jgi:hypothetical protein
VGALGVLKCDNELDINGNIKFEPMSAVGAKYNKIIFSDGTFQDTSISTTDTYWQPYGGATDSPDAIYFTKRVVVGTDPNGTVVNSAVNLAVRGSAGVLGDFYVGNNDSYTFVPKFSVSKDGNMGVTGGATFHNGLYVQGNLGITGSLGVTGGATFYNGLYVQGNLGITGSLGVTGGATFHNGLYVQGNLGITGSLGVTGGATFHNGLYVRGNMGITGSLGVTGGATFHNGLYVQGNMGITGSLGVTGGATFHNGLYVQGNLGITGSLDVTGGATFHNDLYVQGSLGMSTLTTTGEISCGGLKVTDLNNSNVVTVAKQNPIITGTNFVTKDTDGNSYYYITSSGSITFNEGQNIEYWIVGGGGGGGGGGYGNVNVSGGGGGGGGYVVTGNVTMRANTTHSFTIGSGGVANAASTGSSGSATTFNGATAAGGLGGRPGSGTEEASAGGSGGAAGGLGGFSNFLVATAGSFGRTINGVTLSGGGGGGGGGSRSSMPDTGNNGGNGGTNGGGGGGGSLSNFNGYPIYYSVGGLGTTVYSGYASAAGFTATGSTNSTSKGGAGGYGVLGGGGGGAGGNSFAANSSTTTYSGSGGKGGDGLIVIKVLLFALNVNCYASFANNVDILGSLTATSVNTASDYRIKRDVQPIKANIDALNPVQYYNLLSNRHDFGFIAHEIQKHFPMLVSGEKDGNENQSVNYTGIISILVSEIQELKKKVNVLMNKEI